MHNGIGGVEEALSNMAFFATYVAFCDIDILPGVCYSQKWHYQEAFLAGAGGMEIDQWFELPVTVLHRAGLWLAFLAGFLLSPSPEKFVQAPFDFGSVSSPFFPPRGGHPWTAEPA